MAHFQRITFILGALAGLSSCDAVPGTDAYKETQARRIVSASLIDPASAQFRNLLVVGEEVCGEVNAKNKMGAFVGFTRFVVDTVGDEAFLEQAFDYSGLLSAEDLCSSTNEYTSSSTRLSGCERAVELRAAQAGQEEFQSHWAKSCGPITARKVYQPTLAPSPSANTNGDSPDLDSAGDPDTALTLPGNEIETPEPEPENTASAEIETSNEEVMDDD